MRYVSTQFLELNQVLTEEFHKVECKFLLTFILNILFYSPVLYCYNLGTHVNNSAKAFLQIPAFICF